MKRFHTFSIALAAIGLALACEQDPAGDSVSDDQADPADGAVYAMGRGEDRGPRHIAIRDDCDPRDPAWNPTGGCLLRRGRVTFVEFVEELDSPLAAAVVGHQAWRNDPTYLVIRAGQSVKVRNEGGRIHTFTKVAEFGGGKVPNPALNEGLVIAPECPASIDIAPGDRTTVSGLAVGNHRFECCIHPWMRAMIKVEAHRGH
jgi:plastocyanin